MTAPVFRPLGFRDGVPTFVQDPKTAVLKKPVFHDLTAIQIDSATGPMEHGGYIPVVLATITVIDMHRLPHIICHFIRTAQSEMEAAADLLDQQPIYNMLFQMGIGPDPQLADIAIARIPFNKGCKMFDTLLSPHRSRCPLLK